MASEEEQVLELDSAPAESGAKIDLDRLKIAATERVEAMHAAGRTQDNINKTYSTAVVDLLAGQEQATSDALRALAEERRAALDKLSKSEEYKRKALASEVVAGKWDKG
jgi:hypothetical protein